MPCNAEFGIIETLDKNKDYGTSYEPDKYGCVSIDDDILENWWERLTKMKSYFHCYARPETALARYGVMLIPPESLDLFYDIAAHDTAEEYQEFIEPLLELIKKRKMKINI